MVDDRSPAAKAMSVVSQIMTIALVGILPVMAGYGLDVWLATKPLFIILSLAFGMFASIYQLIGLTKSLQEDTTNRPQ